YIHHDGFRLVVPVVRNRYFRRPRGPGQHSELAIPDLPACLFCRNAHFCSNGRHIRPQDMQRYLQFSAKARGEFLIRVSLFTAQHVIYMYGMEFHSKDRPESVEHMDKAYGVRTSRHARNDSLSGFDQIVGGNDVQDLLLEFWDIITDMFHLFPNWQTWCICRNI